MFSGHPTKNNHGLIAINDSNKMTQKQNKQIVRTYVFHMLRTYIMI